MYEYLKDQSGQRIPLKNGDGEQQISSCNHLRDKTFYDNGFFIFTDTSSSSKNRRYFELLDNLGIDCKENTVEGIKGKQLVLIEEEDVVGLPCYVRIKREEWVDKKTNEKRGAWKANRVFPWSEGSRLSPEEVDPNADVPF